MQDPFPRRHQYLLQESDCAGIYFAQVCAKCTCFDVTAALPHPVSYVYWPLLTLLLNRTLLDV